MDGGSPEGRKRPIRKVALRVLKRSVLGGALVMIPGTLGYLTGNIWLFPSLGPTIFLILVWPDQKTATTYNTFMGHIIAIVCGYAAVLAISTAGVPSALTIGYLLAPHVAAAGAAVTVMMLLQLFARATHPPGASTAIMITLGAFSATWQDCLMIFMGVVITTIVGQAARFFLIQGEEEATGP